MLYRDGPTGCVLLVLPTDPAPHLKKVWRAVLTSPPPYQFYLHSLQQVLLLVLLMQQSSSRSGVGVGALRGKHGWKGVCPDCR